MDDELRIAIVGVGYWGTNLLRTFTDTTGISVRTVCETRPELLQTVKSRYPAVSPATSLEKVLHDPAIDAVVVATPPSSHFALASAALTAGKHVWVEKPLALRYADGQRLVTTAR